tara:strand:+ start:1020 stop:1538 length:519 start_codon:yes stop_codon:yes gene_type:complete
MKLIISLFSFVSLFSQGQESDKYLLSKHSVGGLEIGQSVDYLYSLYGKGNTRLIDLYLEAFYSPAIEVRYNGELAFLAELNCNEIYRISVKNPSFKTKEGIHVGSDYGELKSKYTINSIQRGEGNLYVVIEDLAMSFQLDTVQLLDKGVDIDRNVSLDDLPDDIGITSILIR